MNACPPKSVFFPTSSFTIQPNHVCLATHVSRLARLKPGRTQKLALGTRNPSELRVKHKPSASAEYSANVAQREFYRAHPLSPRRFRWILRQALYQLQSARLFDLHHFNCVCHLALQQFCWSRSASTLPSPQLLMGPPSCSSPIGRSLLFAPTLLDPSTRSKSSLSDLSSPSMAVLLNLWARPASI